MGVIWPRLKRGRMRHLLKDQGCQGVKESNLSAFLYNFNK